MFTESRARRVCPRVLFLSFLGVVAEIGRWSLRTASHVPKCGHPVPRVLPVWQLVETLTNMLCVFLHSLWVDTEGMAVGTVVSAPTSASQAGWEEGLGPFSGPAPGPHMGVWWAWPRRTLALPSALTCWALRALRPGLEFPLPLEAVSRSTSQCGEGTVTTTAAWSSSPGPRGKCSLWEAGAQGVACSPFAPITG